MRNRLSSLAMLDKPQKLSIKRSRSTTGKAPAGLSAGKLAGFMKLPVELVYQISTLAHPSDLIHLSRVSKCFRGVFMSRRSQVVWEQCIMNAEMPERPPDLTAPQYVYLMFERDCMSCGAPRASKTCWALRLRLCKSCMHFYVHYRGRIRFDMSHRHPDIPIPKYFFSLLPGTSSNTFHPDLVDLWYLPECLAIFDEYVLLRDDPVALDSFKKSRMAQTSIIMKSALGLSSWQTNYIRTEGIAQTLKAAVVAAERQTRIKAELSDLGWTTDYFPRYMDLEETAEWNKLVQKVNKAAQEFLPNVLPRLVEIVRRVKVKRLREAQEEQVKGHYLSFLRSLSLDDRIAMPHWPDARLLPSIAAALAKHPEDNEPCPSVFVSVVAEAQEYKARVKLTMLRALQRDSDTLDNQMNPYDVLHRACTIFYCGNRGCSTVYLKAGGETCPPLLYLSEILDHLREEWFHRSWCDQDVKLRCREDITAMAKRVLDILGLGAESPRSVVDSLEGRFACLCGHPEGHGSGSFLDLIRHLVNEQGWFAAVRASAKTGEEMDAIIFDDHDLSRLNQLITILPTTSSRPPRIPVEGSAGILSFPPVTSFCSFCYKFAGVRRGFKSKEEVLYHMTTKHHSNITMDDVVQQGSRLWYGCFDPEADQHLGLLL